MDKKEAKAKKEYHEKRVKYYDKKPKEAQKEEKKIGFRY